MADPASKPFFPTEPSSHLLPPSRSSKTLTSTPESKYWRSFRSSELASNLLLPVTSLTFSPSSPFSLAAACSASIRLFSLSSPYSLDSPPFTSLSLPDIAYSPSFRCDGALLAAGCETGVVQVYNPSSSAPLRRLKSHSRATRVVRFPSLHEKLRLFSAGDDALLVQWDVPTESPLLSVPGAHRDYIRAGDPSPVSYDVLATGSYDHSVQIWDFRVSSGSNSILSLNHGAPVESVMFLPSGGLIATAGGNCVKIWDVIGGGRVVHTVESHNKTVTDLALAKIRDGETRLLSVSIDGYLKSFDFSRFKITHSMRYPSQLLSVAFSPNGSTRVVGTNNGVIYMGTKKKREENESVSSMDLSTDFAWSLPEPEKPVLRPTNYRYFKRGQSDKPSEGDFVIKRPERVKLQEHDKLLKKFMHKDALVSVLNKNNPNSIVAVMEELVARRKLIKSIVNLDRDELGLLLRFLHKYVTMPRYARFLMGLAKRVLEIRTEDVKNTEELRVCVRNIKRVVAEELKIQRSLQEVQGMISPLIAIAGK